MLALIARFVVDVGRLDEPNDVFLRQQFSEIKRYIAKYPDDQQQQRALEWIQEHAERYRLEWQKNKLSETIGGARCSDCPLVDDGATSQCDIHEQWAALLQSYIADELDSEQYVKDTLRLLNEHKTRLKIGVSSAKK